VHFSEGKCCGFGKRVYQFITGDWGVPRDWGLTGNLSYMRGRKLERAQISQKDFGWRNAKAVKRRAKANWESVRKRAD